MRLTVRFAALSALIIVSTALIFPVYFNGPFPHPPGPVFDRDVTRLYRREIEQQKPEILFLGDSILTKGVDAAVFEEAINLPTYKMDLPGSASALWYLAVKSNIAPSNPPPRYLIILFRDTLLTAPTFRVAGPYFGLVDKFAGQNEALLLERAYLVQLSPIEAGLEMYFPLYTYRAEVRESVDAGLRHILPALVDCDSSCADDTMQNRLSDIQPDIFAASIIQAEQDLYAPEELNFAVQVERSFLPEIVRMTEQRGIQLILVRAPIRIFPDRQSEPQGLATYMDGLGGYLAQRDVHFLDLAWVEGIESWHFSDPHHMTVEGKAIFTGILIEALKDLIQ